LGLWKASGALKEGLKPEATDVAKAIMTTDTVRKVFGAVPLREAGLISGMTKGRDDSPKHSHHLGF
jgi:N-acetylglutamate synthase/N-acetylornithine aminotransferase